MSAQCLSVSHGNGMETGVAYYAYAIVNAVKTKNANSTALLLITLFAALSYGRVWFIQDNIWDDNSWLLSSYATEGWRQFFETGIFEARRYGTGFFLYLIFGLHRDTGYFYVIWHGINTITQIATPFVLYLLVRDVFPGRWLLAVYAAIALVVFPLDYTLPYASGANYRISLLLSVISIYLTRRAIAEQSLKIPVLSLSLVTAGISYYVFMEAAVALEPARWALIGVHHYRHGLRGHLLCKRVFDHALPYLLLSMPLLAYKLLFKPYGIYAGIYEFDPLFFLRGWDMAKAIGHFLFSHWYVLARAAESVPPATWVLGLAGTIYAALLFPRFSREHTIVMPKIRSDLPIGIAVLFLIVPPVVMFHAFNRPISWGMNSSHAVLAQPGYALLLGWIIERVHHYAMAQPSRLRIATAFMSLWLGLGVLFNNVNIDMFRQSWEEQSRFWTAFTKRFPVLPDKADFFFDVRDGVLYSDLHNNYDYEFQLNLLYARSSKPDEFRKYRAYTMSELQLLLKQGMPVPDSEIHRTTHFGPETLHTADLIVVQYRQNRLMVNREIQAGQPQTEYISWTDKDPSVLQATRPDFPLRSKMNFFTP